MKLVPNQLKRLAFLMNSEESEIPNATESSRKPVLQESANEALVCDGNRLSL